MYPSAHAPEEVEPTEQDVGPDNRAGMFKKLSGRKDIQDLVTEMDP